MVAPVGDPAYATLRPTLKIANGHSVGDGLALHPSLTKLKARFDQGKVAIVRGVGYQPPDLSHFSSTDIWMHGWGGADARRRPAGSVATSTRSRTPSTSRCTASRCTAA